MRRTTPPTHTFATPVFQRPAVMPDDPADVAAVRFEERLVKVSRSGDRKVSWANLARMTGRSAEALKAKYGWMCG
ncbi:MAG: hypothetical protein Q8S03_10265 [Brevundimonas sp.]|uniref:hypothetical protein n=1 Tax=Brevundimonas sp. TaxID=1871086 RepID=UPI0027361579|nr:hypothetical protein [Brevundimonas sp.]MDP3405063.1 hypothetical protein [Brevundimonas sp.]